MKSKYTAAALAFFLGTFGTHRFYLGQRFLGFVYFMMTMIGMMAMFASHGRAPLFILPAMIGFIDSVLFAVMPQDEFDERYNYKKARRPSRREERYYEEPRVKRAQTASSPRATLSELKKNGIEKFRDYDFEGAIEDFEEALKIQSNDPATHFNLACSYSILENKDKAFEHLQAAVDNGFKQFEKIDSHDALSYLRTQPEFDAFVKNGYRVVNEVKEEVKETPKAEVKKDEPKEEPMVLEDNLLDQIIKLGELRDKGVLTEEEFVKQKEKILTQR